MPVTLAQAKLNATDDVDVNAIDEFQKQSWLVDNLTFDDVVNAAGNGATLTYGYTRLATQATAGFRAINTEYVPQEVTKVRASVDLKVMGGSFQIDRVLDLIAAAAETTLQMQQKIKGTVAHLSDTIINGDTAVDANGFDGLSKALAGTSTELGATTVTDWTTVTQGNDSAFKVADDLDNLLALLDGPPTALLANARLLARLRATARRIGVLAEEAITYNSGQVRVERFSNLVLVDMGTKAGTNVDVIPVTAKTVATVAGSYTDLYAVRLGLDGFHGVAAVGSPLVRTWLPDFTRAGAVKTGEVELGPVAVALKATKAAAVLRNIRLS